jgi:hypothetical protein
VDFVELSNQHGEYFSSVGFYPRIWLMRLMIPCVSGVEEQNVKFSSKGFTMLTSVD